MRTSHSPVTPCILEAIGQGFVDGFEFLKTFYPRERPEVILHLDDARGIFLPRDFAISIMRECISGIDHADLDLLALGPDVVEIPRSRSATEDEIALALEAGQTYWDTWDTVCSRAVVTMPGTGDRYTLYQDGDLWLVPEGMSHCDRHGWVWEGDDSGEDSEHEGTIPTGCSNRCPGR